MTTDKKQPTGSAATRLGTRFKNWAARVVEAIEGEPPKPVESMTDMQLIMKALANSHQLSLGDDVRRELRRRAEAAPLANCPTGQTDGAARPSLP